MATLSNFGKKTFVLKICSECWKSEILFFNQQPSTPIASGTTWWPGHLWKESLESLSGSTVLIFFTLRQSSISKTWRTLAEKDMLLLVYHICTLYKQALKHSSAAAALPTLRQDFFCRGNWRRRVEERSWGSIEENQRCRKNSKDFYITNSGHCFLGPARIKHTTLRNFIPYI